MSLPFVQYWACNKNKFTEIRRSDVAYVNMLRYWNAHYIFKDFFESLLCVTLKYFCRGSYMKFKSKITSFTKSLIYSLGLKVIWQFRSLYLRYFLIYIDIKVIGKKLTREVVIIPFWYISRILHGQPTKMCNAYFLRQNWNVSVTLKESVFEAEVDTTYERERQSMLYFAGFPPFSLLYLTPID